MLMILHRNGSLKLWHTSKASASGKYYENMQRNADARRAFTTKSLFNYVNFVIDLKGNLLGPHLNLIIRMVCCIWENRYY